MKSWLTLPVRNRIETRKAIVDLDDFERLAPYSWRLLRGYAKSQKQVNRQITRFSMHRLVLPPTPPLQVDHINGDRLDNRKENLRLVTSRENTLNVQGLRSTNSTGYRGVSRNTVRGSVEKPWAAHIGYDNKKYTLGVYAEIEDAARAYDRAAIKHHGAFAKTNFYYGEQVGGSDAN